MGVEVGQCHNVYLTLMCLILTLDSGDLVVFMIVIIFNLFV